MSTATPEHAEHIPVEHDPEAHDHPSDWLYIKVAIFLAILTAIEVFTYFESVHKMSDNALIAVLSLLMVVKFVLVAGYFMHLKYDAPIFRYLLYSGLVLAIAVYCIMLLAFNYWF